MITLFVRRFRVILNGLEIAGIILLSLLTLGMQFASPEAASTACVLERVGYLGIASAFLLNLRYGLRTSHYVIALLFSALTAFVELWQFSHRLYPSMSNHTSDALALYLYAAGLTLCVGAMIFNTIMIGIDAEFHPKQHISHRYPWVAHTLFSLIMITIATNIFFI